MTDPTPTTNPTAAIVAWMRKRAEPHEADGGYHSAWRDGIRDMADEIEENSDDKCGHAEVKT